MGQPDFGACPSHCATCPLAVLILLLGACNGPVFAQSDNDNFAHRLSLTGNELLVPGYNVDASLEPDEPNHAAPYQAKGSVWWTWTAPADGFLNTFISYLSGHVFSYPVVAVYTGSSPGTLILIKRGLGAPTGFFPVEAGQAYQIAVSSWNDLKDPEFGPFNLGLSLVPPARNDNFANRILLIGTNLEVEGDNRGATVEPGELNHAAPAESRSSIWWSWTAPGDGFLQIGAGTAPYGYAIHGVYTGNSITSLTPLFAPRTDSGPPVPVKSGVDYQIVFCGRAGGYEQFPQPFTFPLRFLPLPPNDDFANRTPLTGREVELNSWLAGASVEPGEPSRTSWPGDRSVWWTWTAPADGVATVAWKSGESPWTVAAYRGDTLAQLVLVATNSPQHDLFFAVRAGEVYQLAVAGSPDPGSGPFTFQLVLSGLRIISPEDGATYPAGTDLLFRFKGGPAGDGTLRLLYNGYYQILTPVTRIDSGVAVSNFGAGEYVFEGLFDTGGARIYRTAPIHFGVENAQDRFATPVVLGGTNSTVSADFRGSTVEAGEPPITNAISGTLWWSWIAPTTGRLFLEGHGAVVEVFIGETLLGLSRLPWMPTYPAGVDVTAGSLYRLRTYRIGNDPGSIIPLDVHFLPRPANDNFADRTELTESEASISIAAAAATVELGEPIFSARTNYLTIWYSWRAPVDGVLQGQVPYASEPPQLALFTGDSLDSLQWVAGPSDSFSAAVSGGQSYAIWIQSPPYLNRVVDFHMRFIPVPAGDAFANRSPLPGTSGQVEGNNLAASSESGEPIIASGKRTVGYSWTVPENGRFELSAEPIGPDASTAEPAAAFFSGDVVTHLALIASSSSARTIPLVAEVRAGNSYAILLDAESNQPGGDYRLRYSFSAAPPNDEFVNRWRISGTRLSFRGTNWSATAQPDEPRLPGARLRRTVWWTWTAPLTGWARLTSQGTNPPPFVAVFTGEGPANLILSSLSPPTLQLESATSFSAQAGQTYQLAAGWLDYSVGGIPITGPGSNTRPDGFELLLDLTTLAMVAPTNGASITAPAQPTFEAATPMEITDGRLTSVSYFYVEDFARSNRQVLLGTATIPPYRLTPTNLPTGYHLISAVATNDLGQDRHSAPVFLRLAPGNDDFSRAQWITGRKLSLPGSLAGAAREAGEPNYLGRTNGASVWYRWTAPSDGNVTVRTGNDDFVVYLGSSLDTLQPVGDGFGHVTFSASKGVTYNLAVDSTLGFLIGSPAPVSLEPISRPPTTTISRTARSWRGRTFWSRAGTTAPLANSMNHSMPENSAGARCGIRGVRPPAGSPRSRSRAVLRPVCSLCIPARLPRRCSRSRTGNRFPPILSDSTPSRARSTRSPWTVTWERWAISPCN